MCHVPVMFYSGNSAAVIGVSQELCHQRCPSVPIPPALCSRPRKRGTHGSHAEGVAPSIQKQMGGTDLRALVYLAEIVLSSARNRPDTFSMVPLSECVNESALLCVSVKHSMKRQLVNSQTSIWLLQFTN